MKRILVVDDSHLMRNRVVQCLTDAGYEVVGKARDGGEAVEFYNTLKPDMVTMDVTMRGKDGITAASEILKMDAGARIVFYTLIEIPNMEARIRALGIDMIVRKGDEENLLKTLASLC